MKNFKCGLCPYCLYSLVIFVILYTREGQMGIALSRFKLLLRTKRLLAFCQNFVKVV